MHFSFPFLWMQDLKRRSRMSMNTRFNKTLACLPTGELEWTEMFSAPAAEELTARSPHGQRGRASPATPSCTQQTRNVTLVVSSRVPALRWSRNTEPCSLWEAQAAPCTRGTDCVGVTSSRSESKLLFWHVHATEGFAKHFKNKQAFKTKSCRNNFLWPDSS